MLINKEIFLILFKRISKSQKKFITYSFIGFTGFILQIICFYFFTNIFSQYKSILFSILIATTWNYTINNFFNFKENKLIGRNLFIGLIKFLILSIGPLIINSLVAYFIYNYFGNIIFSKLFGLFCGFLISYFIITKLVWNYNN